MVKPSSKRYKRKRKQQHKRRVARRGTKRIAKVVKKVLHQEAEKKIVQPSPRQFALFSGVNTNVVRGCFPIFDTLGFSDWPAKGTSANQRVGDSIKLHRRSIRIIIEFINTFKCSPGPFKVRMIYFNCRLGTPTPVQGGTIPEFPNSITEHFTSQAFQRYNIISDRVYDVPQAAFYAPKQPINPEQEFPIQGLLNSTGKFCWFHHKVKTIRNGDKIGLAGSEGGQSGPSGVNRQNWDLHLYLIT